MTAILKTLSVTVILFFVAIGMSACSDKNQVYGTGIVPQKVTGDLQENNNVSKISQNEGNITSDVIISYCRPKAVMGQFAENISLYIDGKAVVKIRSGASGVNKIAIGQVIKFGNKANVFMMRGSDQTAYEEKITENKNHFYLVKAKANIAQGLGAILGGAILGNLVTTNQEDGGGKKSWDVKKLTKSEYESSCN